jgi:hypothetical protein
LLHSSLCSCLMLLIRQLSYIKIFSTAFILKELKSKEPKSTFTQKIDIILSNTTLRLCHFLFELAVYMKHKMLGVQNVSLSQSSGSEWVQLRYWYSHLLATFLLLISETTIPKSLSTFVIP